MLTKISGDPVWSDRCEDVAFNSLPAAQMPDLKALHYLTAANMVQTEAAALAAAGELAGRAVTLHLACAKEVVAMPLDGPILKPEAARDYLAALTTDFLDVKCAEQLPFEILQEKEWPKVYREEGGAGLDAALFADWRWREGNESWGYNATRPNEMKCAARCAILNKKARSLEFGKIDTSSRMQRIS